MNCLLSAIGLVDSCFPYRFKNFLTPEIFVLLQNKPMNVTGRLNRPKMGKSATNVKKRTLRQFFCIHLIKRKLQWVTEI